MQTLKGLVSALDGGGTSIANFVGGFVRGYVVQTLGDKLNDYSNEMLDLEGDNRSNAGIVADRIDSGIASGISQAELKAQGNARTETANKDTESSWLDNLQDGLSVAGMAPGLGIFADAANTLVSLGRGRWKDAAFNAVAMVPGLGQATQTYRFGNRAYKAVDDAVMLQRGETSHITSCPMTQNFQRICTPEDLIKPTSSTLTRTYINK